MMQLAWPWMLLALPLPWLLSRLLPPAPPRGSALFVPFAATLSDTGTVAPPAAPRLRTLLWLLVWIALVAAAARPQWLGDPEPVPTSGRRVLLAVDISGSMRAEDMADGHTRLEVVQAIAGRFLEGRRGDQVGLILFGTQPYVQAPLTADLETANRFLQQAMVGMAGNATAIGDAIGLALKRLRDDTQAGDGDTVLILLTDGSNTAGAMPPLQAAQLAAQAGLRIHTIGVGNADAGLLGLFAGGNADLDERTLKAIASATGGEYFRATGARALQQVYAEIDKLEPVEGREQWYRPTTEWFFWPLAAALLLSVGGALHRARA